MEPKQRFKKVREHYNLSMRGFGEKLGLTASSVSSIEYGTRVLSEKHIKLICAAFPEISEDWLRTGEGEMLLPKTEADSISDLTSDPVIRSILEAYLDLDAQGRQTFQRFFNDAIALIKGAQPPSSES